MASWNRRDFMKTTAAGGVATALSSMPALGASDRVRLGFIALGNRGDQVLDAFLAHKDAEVVAVCDIYQPYMDFASKKAGTNPKQFKDYRKLLDLKEHFTFRIVATKSSPTALRRTSSRPALRLTGRWSADGGLVPSP